MIEDEEYIRFQTSIGYVLIYPRFEKVSSSKGGEVFFYELLSTVYMNNEFIDPESFYLNIDYIETLEIYKKCLTIAESKGICRVGINSCVEFITLGHFESLVSVFPNLEFYVEISEQTFSFELNVLKFYVENHFVSGRIRFLLDDFGMQGANFSAVKEFGFYGVKLSKECFWDLYHNRRNLLLEVIDFLKFKSEFVIVEGVDSEDKMSFCTSLGVLMQGRYIDKFGDLDVQSIS